MASKLGKLLIGGASVGTGAYLTTWLLTGDNSTVCIYEIIICTCFTKCYKMMFIKYITIIRMCVIGMNILNNINNISII